MFHFERFTAIKRPTGVSWNQNKTLSMRQLGAKKIIRSVSISRNAFDQVSLGGAPMDTWTYSVSIGI